MTRLRQSRITTANLTRREQADAINQYNSLSNSTAPTCYNDDGTLSTRYRAGVDHIYMRVPVPNLCSSSYLSCEPRASVELMHKVTDGPWQPWHSYFTVSADGQTMLLLLHTSKTDSKADPVALTPGTHFFKIRRVSTDGKPMGKFSPFSAPLSVV